MIFVDTNYFLRFLLNDISSQHQTAVKLFKQASQGKEKLITNTIVIFEVYWILKKIYGQKSLLTKNSLLEICRLEYLLLPDRNILINAITNFAHFNYDLEDSFHFFFAQSQKTQDFATFDQKLKTKFKSLKI